MDYRPILFITGMLLSTLAISMVFPMLVDLYYGNPDWKTFFLCIIWTGFFGGTLILSNMGLEFNLSIRQAFLMTTSSWLVIALFAAFPLWLSELNMSFTDAFFESMSGITTTGSTVMTGLNSAPPGILLWRAILQWLGGIGIILMAMSVLPFLKVGGMQLFETELSEKEKAMPRLTSMASSIGIIYVFITLACAVLYQITGMSPFDAITHAMTTVSTGGFSTFDESFSHYHAPWAEIVCIIFMIAGGIPFVLFLKALNGSVRPLFTDSQVRWFLSILLVATVILTFYMTAHHAFSFGEALRRSAFNVVSLVTGTGFVNGNYGSWGVFPVSAFFFLMVVGGCAGSTSCGIKVFRFQVLYEVANVQLKQLLHPHGIFIPHYNKKPMPVGVPISVMSFFFMYALCFAVIAVLLSFVGLDFVTAMSGAATSISNVGPGLGQIIGPVGNFQPLPDSAKWILSVGMLFGRLEIFPLLILMTSAFWRK